MHTKRVFKNGLVMLLVICMMLQSLCSAAAATDEIAEDTEVSATAPDEAVGEANDEQTETATADDAQASDDVASAGDTAEVGAVDEDETPEVIAPIVNKNAEDMTLEDYKNILSTYNIDKSILTYKQYIATYPKAKTDKSIVIAAKDYYAAASSMEGMKVVDNSEYKNLSNSLSVDGLSQSLYTTEEGYVSYKFTVEQAGYYYINQIYYPVAGKNADIERAYFIDGKLPYAELSDIKFSRIWVNSGVDFDILSYAWSWKSDNQGNNLKPSQVESPDWMSSYLYDSNGYITSQLPVYLESGEHVLTLVSIKEPMLLYSISMNYVENLPSYSEYKAANDAKGASAAVKSLITIQGENAVRKSSQMLYPQQDQSSPAVSPYSPRYLLNNVIGGNSWRLVGSWIEWDFDVVEAGYYNIGLNVKQNFTKGVYVSRKISVDGEVPFEEFSAYGFQYESTWRQEIFCDEKGNAYCIYLSAGKHTLRMETVLGEFADIVSDVQLCVTKLQAIYRQILCITGTSPDSWKDYQIANNLPNLEAECIEVRDLLNDTIKRLQALVGKGSDKETVLITMRDQLDDIIDDVEYVVRVVSTFRTNIRACGTWITQVIEQPLAIDEIYILSDGNDAPKLHDSWWRKFIHEMKRLFYSFVIDYNMIGDVSTGDDAIAITLWVGTGRDQANVIKSLIDETFTNQAYKNPDGSEYFVNVNVMLVDINSLLQATLAGSGPDVAIQVANDWPMNYGIRHAVTDLTQFSDYAEVIESRFRASAMEAFTFTDVNGKHIYGLPETQTFAMMFYRKDILSELGLTIPTTWDEMKVVLTVLSQNNMDLGMLPTESNFAMILYQNGGEYYNESGSKSALDSEEAISAFRTFTEYYTDFKMETATSVEERFRTGEAPIIITDYTYYNTLQVSAPDIAGLWGMACVPGTVQEDGTVNSTVASSGTACVIMEASEHKQACWEFLKWWTSANTQALYSSEMESLMGASARVATANIEAFSMIPWPSDIATVLSAQFDHVRGIRQVPGGYFTWRNVNNAFYAVTTSTDSATPREELMDRVLYINEEITYKRKEFNLD